MSAVQVNDENGKPLGRVRIGDTKLEALERLALAGGLFDKDDVGLLCNDGITKEGAPYVFKPRQHQTNEVVGLPDLTKLSIISPDKRKFTINGSIDKTARDRYFFVETTESNEELYQKILLGNYIMLHGPRAVGKSTRMLQACDDLSQKYNCMNVSLHDIDITSASKFWKSLSQSLVDKYGQSQGIRVVEAGHEFNQMWYSLKGRGTNKKFVLFIDEFDALQNSPTGQETVDAVLSTFRGLKQSAPNHHLQSVIVIGVFGIVRMNTRSVSPFNVGEQVVAPLMTLTQIKQLFATYMQCRSYIVAEDVIKDIYQRTGGHAGLVNLCGKAIDEEIRISLDSDGNSLTLSTWLSTLHCRLETWLTDFPTIKRLVQDLVEKDELRASCRKALSEWFLCCEDAVPSDTLDVPVRDFLISVGMVREIKPGKLCLSNSMLRMLAIWQIVPVDRRLSISEALPVRNGSVDMLQLLRSSKVYFPVDDLIEASQKSFKMAGRGPRNAVPHEYYYQSQLASIIRAWIPKSWRFFPEVKTIGDKRLTDFVLEKFPTSGNERFVLELEATSSNAELREHYTRAAEYGKMIEAGHVWVLHFSAVELDTTTLPLPECGSNVHVLHLVHSIDGGRVSWTAHYCAPRPS